MQLEGKVFAVTGGGDGIGREVVLGLLRAGARVAAVDRSAEGLGVTRAEAVNEGAGEFLSTHAVDVTDRAAVEALPETVVAEHGAVDGLLNVAGVIQPFVTVGELAVEDVRRVLDVNFWGVVNTCQAFLPYLQARPEAAVLNVSSMGALTPVPGQAAYGASKAAVKLFTEALYCELKDGPVAVTIALPGAVETGIAENSGVSLAAPADDTAASEASSFPRTSAPDAAEAILGALEQGAFRVVIGRDAKFVDRASRLAPRWAADLITRRMQSLLERR